MHSSLRSLARPQLLVVALLLTAAGCGEDDSPDEPDRSAPVIDLRVDANRSGSIETDAADEDEGEDRWDASTGAVFLANLDDDDSDGVADGADDRVSNEADARDLAPIVLQPWEKAPKGSTATFSIDEASQAHVRLFRVTGDPALAESYTAIPDGTVQLGAEELRAGARFALEGREFVTSTAAGAWSGFVDLSLSVSDSKGNPLGTDAARMRVAPLLLQFNTAPTEAIYFSDGGTISRNMRDGVSAVGELAGIEGTGLDLPGGWNEWDPWTQDFFDVGYTSMPGPGGEPVGMKIAIRSAQPDRPAGGVVNQTFEGPDWGSVFVHATRSNADTDGYSMNSFGNWDVVPPYGDFPLGRNVWGSGSTSDESPDPVFADFVRAQRVQPEIIVDTSWLIVGHVDEVFSWVKSDSPRGWRMLAADDELAHDMLLELQAQGHGGQTLFAGKNWMDWDGNETPAEISIDDALADADLMAASQEAHVRTGEMLEIIRSETGLADDEITPIPFLTEDMAGWGLVAWQPGTVNLLHVDGSVLIPEPFGPQVDGVDVFRADLESRLTDAGLNVNFMDDWDLYHRNLGEVHCGSNVSRRMDLRWWESGR